MFSMFSPFFMFFFDIFYVFLNFLCFSIILFQLSMYFTDFPSFLSLHFSDNNGQIKSKQHIKKVWIWKEILVVGINFARPETAKQ